MTWASLKDVKLKNESEILELLKVFNTTGGIPEDEIKDWMYMNLK